MTAKEYNMERVNTTSILDTLRKERDRLLKKQLKQEAAVAATSAEIANLAEGIKTLETSS
jgi:hypothetical protein